MFDANARHIAIGRKFFAEVHEVPVELEALGVKCGDILLCEHLETDSSIFRRNIQTKVVAEISGSKLETLYRDSDSEDYSWLVYSGCPDGTGFINDTWKQKALDFLGGKWENADE